MTDHTENAGGTDASFALVFESVEMVMIVFACFAVGCPSSEAKNVADTVAANSFTVRLMR
jgi:hypothetical protein